MLLDCRYLYYAELLFDCLYTSNAVVFCVIGMLSLVSCCLVLDFVGLICLENYGCLRFIRVDGFICTGLFGV